jgi:hypothetical protein
MVEGLEFLRAPQLAEVKLLFGLLEKIANNKVREYLV